MDGVSVAGGVTGVDAYGILSTPSTLGPSYTGAPTDRSGDTPKPPLVENHPHGAFLERCISVVA